MPEIIFANYKTDLLKAVKPLIVNYNRIEGNPRTHEFEDSLRAEVRDPLWLLARQWQFGEFAAEDAATAYQANIWGEHAQPSLLTLHSEQVIPFDKGVPLETLVEREAVDPTAFLRAQMGRHFVKLMRKQGLGAFVGLVRQRYPISTAADAEDRDGVKFTVAVNRRVPDGYVIYQEIGSSRFQDWIQDDPAFSDADVQDGFAALQTNFTRWFRSLYNQPESGEMAWRSEHLEYNFSIDLPTGPSSGKKESLIAEQYASGHLDWHAFDQRERDAPAAEGNVPQEVVQTFIPTGLEFLGMPHPRYWQMEDRQVDFGKIDTGPTALLSVLLAEYGLVYSNDWFVLPYELDINTVCEIKGILVKDVFGMHTLVEPAIEDPEMDWQRFAAFHHTELSDAASTAEGRNRLYLVPAVGKLMSSEPLERVNFMRDEMSNMVWAIENRIPSQAGFGRDVKRSSERITGGSPAPEAAAAEIRYLLGSRVPDNWIPFVPVHKKGQTVAIPQEIRLQRARLPQAPGPKGVLLSENQPTFFVEEEEVPRAGIILERCFQRTRWLHGKTLLWIGRTKKAGRGEGWSGLMFDQIFTMDQGSADTEN